MPHLILLEDERELREEVCEFLQSRGFRVTEAGSIREFWNAFRIEACSIAVIDRQLPDGDGLDVVRTLRQERHPCGLVMFTARDTSQDRISAYRDGADHYLTKPILLDELGAVVESLARRLDAAPEWRFDPAAWELHTPTHTLVPLTGQEAVFLSTLAQARGQVVSRRELVAALGKNFASYDPRNLDAVVKRLRSKVEATGSPPLPVKTRHGSGYQLAIPLAMTGAS